MATKNVILKVGAKGVKGTVAGLKKVSGGLASIGKKAAIVGAGFTALSTKLAGDFQKNLLEISTLLKDDVDRSLKTIDKSLRSAASASGLALDSLSKAQYDIISAGFGNASDSAIVLEQSMKLAVGGVTSAAQAADLLTSAINAYGGTSADAQRISDVLFTTVKEGKTTIGELGSSIGLVLPFAKSFNLSIQDVGASIAVLTASGISTAESVTALKGAISGLESPSDSARKAMQTAGIEVKRFDDGTVDLFNTIEQFKGVDAKLLAKFIPEKTAQLAIKTLANDTEGLQDSMNAFKDSSGATETAFDKMQKGINTQLGRLKNNFSNIMITIGNALVDKLQPKIDAINTEFTKLNEIGFDNLAESIKDNIPLILDTLVNAFKEAFRMIELQAGLFARIIADKLMFRENDELHKEMQKALNKSFAFSSEEIKQSFEDMYEKIVSDATIASEKQKELSQSVIEGEGKKAEATGQEGEKIKEKIEFITLEQMKRDEHANAVLEQTEMMKQANVSSVEIEKFRANQIANFERQILATKSASFATLAGGLSKLNQSSKGAAKVSQRLAQTEALISAYVGYNKALAAGAPPFNFISAAGVLAAGLANVVTIESQKFAKGGIVQGDPSKGDSVPIMATAGELILNEAQQANLANSMSGVTINIAGNIIGEESFVRDTLIPEIERAGTLA